jgi:hypothetical protein
MVKFDIVVEALIDAPPHVAMKAILDRNSGTINWGMPQMESKLKEGSPIGTNMVCVGTFHTKGMKTRIVFKTTKIVEDKLMQIEYLEGGDFKGSEEYTLEPLDGKTRIRLQMNVQPNRLLLAILAPVVKKTLVSAAQDQFKLLNDHVKKN